MATNYEVKRGSDLRGRKYLRTTLQIEPGRILEIETSKGSNGFIDSDATAFKLEDGFKSHSFAFGGGGDYRRTMIKAKGRATEKTLAAQHAQALEMAADQLATAKTFYGVKS